jgi:hypothetical protein
VRELRDQATRTLYWFGRGDPSALFDLTLDSLGVDDPYVPERLLAACYGVAMAHQLPDADFPPVLRRYLCGLRDALAEPSAKYPTSHMLARLYVRGTFSLAQAYHPEAIPDELQGDVRMSFAAEPPVEPLESSDPRAKDAERSLRMDFTNYTLGALFDDRRNYDMNHSGHRAAVAHVLGTVWALGWREEEFGAIDRRVGTSTSRMEPTGIERYGKKYGWIGYHTFAGMLSDGGRLTARDARSSIVDIDPSFPEPSPRDPIRLPSWARAVPVDDRRWLRHGVVEIPDELLFRPAIGPSRGPWLAVGGQLVTKRRVPDRRVFGIVRALLVARAHADRLVAALSAPIHPSEASLRFDEPASHWTFAGEFPWSPEFTCVDEDGDITAPYREVVRVDDGDPIEIEILAHRFAWGSHHSPTNQAGNALIPSSAFSAAFDLRGGPQSFDQMRLDGTRAAVSLRGPAGFIGEILYLREDLMLQYAAERTLLWFVWGERQLYPHQDHVPVWLVQARREGADVWREVRKGEALVRAFRAARAPRISRATRRSPRRR